MYSWISAHYRITLSVHGHLFNYFFLWTCHDILSDCVCNSGLPLNIICPKKKKKNTLPRWRVYNLVHKTELWKMLLRPTMAGQKNLKNIEENFYFYFCCGNWMDIDSSVRLCCCLSYIQIKNPITPHGVWNANDNYLCCTKIFQCKFYLDSIFTHVISFTSGMFTFEKKYWKCPKIKFEI